MIKLLLFLEVFILSCNYSGRSKDSSKQKNLSPNNSNRQINFSKDSLSNKDILVTIHTIVNKLFSDYSLLDYATGDLNSDSLSDLIIVIQKRTFLENIEENTYIRKVVLLVNKQGQFQLGEINDNAIECSDCGGPGVGDPL